MPGARPGMTGRVNPLPDRHNLVKKLQIFDVSPVASPQRIAV
jgi:hypothetical protein